MAADMKRGGRLRLPAVLFTVGLISLISFAVGLHLLYSLVTLATVALGVSLFYLIFPGSRFFTIELTNFLGMYACLFIVFIEANFADVPTHWVNIGFALPIVAFIAGAWWRRTAIAQLIATPRLRGARHLARLFVWLVPVFTIGAATVPLSNLGLGQAALSGVFLTAMALIALVVLWVSADVFAFMLDTGLLFEDFFKRISGLLVPTVAFFTFYSLIVIVFAAVYRIIDRLMVGHQFLVLGQARDLSFTESLYFSIITLSTVGYGDVVPTDSLVQAIVAVQIVCGVALLLFGFSEISRYARDHPRRHE